MLFRMNGNRKTGCRTGGSAGRSRNLLWRWLTACVVLGGTFAATSFGQSQPGSLNPDKPILMPEANRLPDANDRMAMREQQGKKANFQAANVERKRQIADDSARLLKLASDLKAEVDKTSKDTLSLGVIRKAEEIEKLAHTVKEKMKLTMNGN
jgi:hypothetical protein